MKPTHPDSWERVKTIFYQALELNADERAVFVREICTNESPAVEKEVWALLSAHESSEGILEEPLADVAAQLELALPANNLLIGQSLGDYQVIELLGAGGMGEVYLAEDKRLGRKVALKILTPEFVSIPNLVQRFEREARAASALNHPNIVTIYGVGREKSIHYIAAEYINGSTLRQISASKQMSLAEILDIALQVASALAAAHDAGIVHRDIKPQNIMMRPDRIVKVLDFGIAKLVEGQFGNQKSEISTATGMVLGTASYMSPEQARGLAVDHRSDIWSLGVTLYEMLTNQPPFKGNTTSDIIVSILEREPISVVDLAPSVPKELDRIIKRCLSKTVDSRYQTVAELNHDLRNVPSQSHEDLQYSAKRSSVAALGFPQTNSPPGINHPTEDNLFSLRTTLNQLPGAKTQKNRFNYWSQFKRWQFVTAIILLTFLGRVFASNSRTDLFKNVNWFGSKDPAKSFQLGQITRLTTAGNAMFASVSPDGKYVAYVTQESDKQGLWIRQTATAPAKPLLPATENFYKGLTFSPDSNFIYYVVHEKALGLGVLYAVSLLGGESRKIMEDVDSPIAFAPDGKSYAFMRGFDDNGVNAFALLIANFENQTTRQLAVHRDPDLFARQGFAWSPDGKTIIAATTKVSDNNTKQMSLVEIQTSDGSERPFTSRTWTEIGRVVWLGNNQAVVMTALDANSGQPQVVQISYPQGEVEAITKNLTGYSSVSATTDGRSIVAVESDRISHIWTAPSDNLAHAKRITPGVGRYYQPSWTPDNKIIYVSEEDGNKDIWTMEADGSNPKRLTFDKAADYKPIVSPDGRYIVFTSNRAGTDQVWRMGRDGSNLRRLTDGNKEVALDISHDNKHVYYVTDAFGMGYLWSIPIDSGNATRMFDIPIVDCTISLDGKWLACLYLNEQTNAKWLIGIAPIKGEEIAKTLNISYDNAPQVFRWTPNGKNITYTTALDDLHNLWNYPVNEAAPKQLTSFDSSSQILYFSWSRDGTNLVCLRGSKPKDVVYLKTGNN